ncbi:MAG: tetratricopeptide repeat protein [Planctomycetota bacterium]|nr:tetratricopeptide repeat protein [Planctomycetota bacterium]
MDKAISHLRRVLKSPVRKTFDQDSYLSLAYALFEKGKYGDALDTLKELEKKYTAPQKKLQFLFQRGMCQYFLGDYSSARRDFERLVEQDKNKDYSVESLYWLAECYYKLNRYEDAIRAYFKVKKQTEDKERLVKILYGLGYAYFKSGQFGESLKTFQEIVRFAPESRFTEGSRFKAAECWYRLGDYEKAVEYFKLVLCNNEYASASAFFIGECYYRMDEFEAAVPWLEKAIEGADDLTKVLAQRTRGLCFLKLGEYSKAEVLFSKMAEEASADKYRGEATAYHADSLLAQGKLSKALDKYREALTKYSEHIDIARTRYQVGLCQTKLGMMQAALETFSNTHTRFEGKLYGAKSLYEHGEVLRKLGRLTEAIAVFREMATYRGANVRLRARAQYAIGVCLFNNDSLTEALEVFTKLAQTSEHTPTRVEAMFQAARTHRQLGELEKFVTVMNAIVKNFPEHDLAPVALFELGSELRSSGSLEQAASAFERLTTDYADSAQADDAQYQLALIAVQSDRPDRAIELVDALIERYPESDLHTSALVLKAGSFARTGRTEKAMDIYRSLLATRKGGEKILVSLEYADLLFTLDKYNEALDLYTEASSTAVDEWAARAEFGSGRCLRALGRSDDALAHFMNVVLTFPASVKRDEAILSASEILVENKKYERAIKLLELHSDKSRAQKRIERIKRLADK